MLPVVQLNSDVCLVTSSFGMIGLATMAQTRRPSLYREPFAAAELAQLVCDPVYYGAGLPRGDGRLVAVLPALFANDLYLYPLHIWLRRMGYSPVRSTLTINAGCPDRLASQIEAELRNRMRPETKVAIIGHSRGGILARAIAARLQDEVSHLIVLGSPIGALPGIYEPAPDGAAAFPPASRLILDASTQARRLLDPDCAVPHCGCPFINDIRRPLGPGTRVVCIYSRDDPIVLPVACHLPGARNVEVGGTHSGLVYNRAVYRELAAALAGP